MSSKCTKGAASDPIHVECDCKNNGKVLLFYNYTPLKLFMNLALEIEKFSERTASSDSGIRGKIRIAPEGFNITIGGTSAAVADFIAFLLELDSRALTYEMTFDRLFNGIELFYKGNLYDREFVLAAIHVALSANSLADIASGSLAYFIHAYFKPSAGCEHVFPILSVKRVSMLFDGIPSRNMKIPCTSLKLAQTILDIPSQEDTQIQSLSPPDFHAALLGEEKPLILDCRNYYETQIGAFNGAILPPVRKYSLFPAYIRAQSNLVTSKKVFAYCTGGVRCETAAQILVDAGASKVVTLQGGILSYMDYTRSSGVKSLFIGSNYVFDARGALAGDSISSRCRGCGVATERLEKCVCHAVMIICKDCVGLVWCCESCREGKPRPCLCEEERAKALR